MKDWADELASQYPDLLTTSVRKNGRQGKVFVDYLRNAYGQTSVCPYSVRPNKNTGAAMPVAWKDLDGVEKADEFTLRDVVEQ